MKRMFAILTLMASLTLSALAQDLTVAPDGSGDFTTVQDAIDAVPDFRKQRTVILIKPGTYKEKLVLADSKSLVSFMGTDPDTTVLTFDDYAQKKNRFGEEMGTTGSSGFFIFGDGFTAENITFSNTAGPVGQAVAVRVTGDRAAFRNCRFLGYQDTLYPQGDASRQYYKDCHIEGTVDFIFGASTAVFENCTIHSKSPGYLTAPSTPEDKPGLVFLNCDLTAAEGLAQNTVYLGRPWRPYGQSVFIGCRMGAHIRPEGWNNWGRVSNETTARFAESGNTGPGADTSGRVAWSHQLTADEASTYTVSNILGDWAVTEDLWPKLAK